MKNRKKLVALVMVLALAFTTLVGGTLAYFTDTDDATNTFTVGNIDIDLVEKKADLKTDWEESELMPGSSTANNVAKRVWVENTGDNEAWVWIKLYIPEELDVTDNASLNSFHMNTYGQFGVDYYDETWTKGYSQTPITDGVLDEEHNPTVDGMVAVEKDHLWTEPEYLETVDGYNVYLTKMVGKLQPDEISLPALRQVYMDSGVKQCDVEDHEEGCLVLKSDEHYTGAWELKIEAYAIQDAEFENVDVAYNAYDGE